MIDTDYLEITGLASGTTAYDSDYGYFWSSASDCLAPTVLKTTPPATLPLEPRWTPLERIFMVRAWFTPGHIPTTYEANP